MRIDLGSRSLKFQNCVETDRIAYPDTDLVFDTNHKLPLKDDSVEFVMASQCLEYAYDLQAAMKELYRICRHKAIVCIVAPYAHVSSHIVNPEYKQLFNEHSPRYWTHSSDTIVDQNEFSLSRHDSWSLLDEGHAPIDFRVLRMEFFYFPPFQTGYDSVELSLLRQSQLNVAHQIMFHLLVVKKPITTEEMLLISTTEFLEEPDFVKELRAPQESEQDMDVDPLFFMDHMSSITPKNGMNQPDNNVPNKYVNRTSSTPVKSPTTKKSGAKSQSPLAKAVTKSRPKRKKRKTMKKKLHS